MSDAPLSLWLLIANAASAWFLTGLIWVIQVVHYPLFASVGRSEFAAYEASHTRLITVVVGPVMLLELATSVLLLVVRPAAVPMWAAATGLALVVIVWPRRHRGGDSRGRVTYRRRGGGHRRGRTHDPEPRARLRTRSARCRRPASGLQDVGRTTGRRGDVVEAPGNRSRDCSRRRDTGARCDRRNADSEQGCRRSTRRGR